MLASRTLFIGVITYFWVTPKSFFLFLKKKKKLHGAVLNGTVHLLLPCQCRDRGEEDFLNLFPAHPLLLYLPTCLTTYTTHTLINGETGDPCPGHHALCLYRVW